MGQKAKITILKLIKLQMQANLHQKSFSLIFVLFFFQKNCFFVAVNNILNF